MKLLILIKPIFLSLIVIMCLCTISGKSFAGIKAYNLDYHYVVEPSGKIVLVCENFGFKCYVLILESNDSETTASTASTTNPTFRILKSDLQSVKPGVMKGKNENVLIYLNESADPRALDEFKPKNK